MQTTSKFFPKNEELASVKKEELSFDKKESVTVTDVKINKRSSTEIKPEVEPKQTKWEPEHWKQILENIKKMREKRSAPVDSLGASKCYDQTADEKVSTTISYQIFLNIFINEFPDPEISNSCFIDAFKSNQR